MKRIFLIPIIIQVVCALAMGQEPLNNGQAARQVFTGTWKANVAKSQRDPNHQFKSLTLIVEFSEDAVLLTYKGVNAAGKEEVGTTKLYPDGKEHGVAQVDGVVQVTKWQGPRLLESVAMKDGKVMGKSTYEVSDDGKELTAIVGGIDAKGREFKQMIIFDRE